MKGYLNYFLISVCLLLGVFIAAFLTTLQATFLQTIGISKFGAIALEPVLVIASFLIGIKVSMPHRLLSFIFLILISIGSLTAVSSIYTKHLFMELEDKEINAERLESHKKSEEVIRDALDNLVHRGASSKSTIKIIEGLKEQQQNIKEVKDITEVQAIGNTLSVIFKMEPYNAILMFGILLSIITVFAPSFLLFSSGLMINKLKDSKPLGDIEPTLPIEDIDQSLEEGIEDKEITTLGVEDFNALKEKLYAEITNDMGRIKQDTQEELILASKNIIETSKDSIVEELILASKNIIETSKANVVEELTLASKDIVEKSKGSILKEVKESLLPEIQSIKNTFTNYINDLKSKTIKDIESIKPLDARAQLKLGKSKSHLNAD